MLKKTEVTEKVLTPEQLVELSILDREIELAKQSIQPKFDLVVAKKQELAKAQESYDKAHDDYSEAYKEILDLEAKIDKLVN